MVVLVLFPYSVKKFFCRKKITSNEYSCFLWFFKRFGFVISRSISIKWDGLSTWYIHWKNPTDFLMKSLQSIQNWNKFHYFDPDTSSINLPWLQLPPVSKNNFRSEPFIILGRSTLHFPKLLVRMLYGIRSSTLTAVHPIAANHVFL